MGENLPRQRTSVTLVARSEGSSWSDWAECRTEGNVTDLCRFRGHGSGEFKVKLCSDPSRLSRTFYTPTLTMNKIGKRVCFSSPFMDFRSLFWSYWLNNCTFLTGTVRYLDRHCHMNGTAGACVLKILVFCFKVKTSPPSQRSRWWKRNKLCLKWDAPLPTLYAHLQYEVCYQIRGTDAVMVRGHSWTVGHFIYYFKVMYIAVLLRWTARGR